MNTKLSFRIYFIDVDIILLYCALGEISFFEVWSMSLLLEITCHKNRELILKIILDHSFSSKEKRKKMPQLENICQQADEDSYKSPQIQENIPRANMTRHCHNEPLGNWENGEPNLIWIHKNSKHLFFECKFVTTYGIYTYKPTNQEFHLSQFNLMSFVSVSVVAANSRIVFSGIMLTLWQILCPTCFRENLL